MKKGKKSFADFLNNKLHTPKWLFLLLVISFIFRIPSFFEPYSYGDEMIYLTLGEAIRRGIPLYNQIHDNKPPLIYIIAALAGSLFWFKAILAIWNLITIFFFWKLSTALFPKNQRLQKISTLIFALLTTLPILEGNIVNAEMFMIGPTIIAFYILLSQRIKPTTLFAAGALFSVSSLFKVPAFLDLPAIIFLWFTLIKRINRKALIDFAKNTFYLLVGFLTPTLIVLIWFLFQGALKDYVNAAYLQNIGYLSSWRPSDITKPFIIRNLPLLLRMLAVFLGFAILYFKRFKLSKEFIFVTAWLLLSLFAATLSERPYPHYLIQTVPAVSILFAMLFSLKNKEQILCIIPLTIFFIVPYYFKFWRYPVVPYYLRFVKFVTRDINKDQYFSGFASDIPRNYQVANFIVSSTKPEEKIFVWGDDSMIYALSKRLPPVKYVADYHILDFSEPEFIIAYLNKDMPSFIVTLPDAPNFPELEIFIRDNYGLAEEFNGANIWRLLNPKVRSLIAK